MSKSRLEAFSDGVIAIIITIMVLELKAPHGTDLADLRPVMPSFLSYVLSFVYVAIYWNNHHHLLQAVHTVDGRIMWANLHLLFWLSLTPFVTAWMGDNHLSPLPVAAYGIVMLFAGFAFLILSRTLVLRHGRESALARALGRDLKGKSSLALYATAVVMAFLNTWVAEFLYVFVAAMWLVPDRRIERVLVE